LTQIRCLLAKDTDWATREFGIYLKNTIITRRLLI